MQASKVPIGSLRIAIHDSITTTPNVLSRVAIIVAQNAERIGELSITDIAHLAQTGESSIVRYSRTFGYSGYRDFKIALAAEVEREKERRLTTHFAPADTNVVPEFANISSAFQQSLAASTRLLDFSQMQQLARRLRQANHVGVIGVGASKICADVLAYRLIWLGIPVHSLISAREAEGFVCTFSSSSVAIGISYSGVGTEASDFLENAAKKDAHTLAITTRPNTLITKTAMEVLLLSHDGPWPENGSARLVPAVALFSECLAQCINDI